MNEHKVHTKHFANSEASQTRKLLAARSVGTTELGTQCKAIELRHPAVGDLSFIPTHLAVLISAEEGYLQRTRASCYRFGVCF